MKCRPDPRSEEACGNRKEEVFTDDHITSGIIFVRMGRSPLRLQQEIWNMTPFNAVHPAVMYKHIKASLFSVPGTTQMHTGKRS